MEGEFCHQTGTTGRFSYISFAFAASCDLVDEQQWKAMLRNIMDSRHFSSNIFYFLGLQSWNYEPDGGFHWACIFVLA